MYNKYQTGLGMVEVLVSLMLLVVAVLGFSGLQLHAFRLTQDNSQLTTAVEIASDFKGRYMNMVSMYSGATEASGAMQSLSATYLTLFASTPAGPQPCANSVCNIQQVVKSDVAALKLRAGQAGMSLRLVNCAGAVASPSVSAPVCLLVAWGDTKPEIGDTPQSCITTADVYQPMATCYRAEGVL